MAGMNLDQNLIGWTKLRDNPKACITEETVKLCTDKLLQLPNYRKEIGLEKQTFTLLEIPGLFGQHQKKVTLWRLASVTFYDTNLQPLTLDVYLEDGRCLILTDSSCTTPDARRYISRCAPEKFVRYILELGVSIFSQHSKTAAELDMRCRSWFDLNFRSFMVADKSFIQRELKPLDEWEKEWKNI